MDPRKSSNLPRSRSSPSPPASKGTTARSDAATRRIAQNGRAVRQRHNSSSSSNTTALPKHVPVAGQLDWSTSYQAGSSSSASRSGDDSETEDEQPNTFRGRAFSSRNGVRIAPRDDATTTTSTMRRRPSPHVGSSGDSGSGSTSLGPRAAPFTRSRSPAVVGHSNASKTSTRRYLSPAVTRSSRRTLIPGPVTFFPAVLQFHIPLLPTSWTWTFSADFRKCGESHILLGAILYATFTMFNLPDAKPLNAVTNAWIVKELLTLSVVVVLYSLWTHSTLSHPKQNLSTSAPSPSLLTSSALSSQSTQQPIPSSPRLADHKELRRNSTPAASQKSDFGFIWMSVPKNYRESHDDGIFTGLLLGPLIASGLLVSALRSSAGLSSFSSILPEGWLIEAPAELHNSQKSYTALEALVQSRYSLVDLATFCSTILLLQVCASWWLESRYLKLGNTKEGERASVPRSEGRRSWYYIVFTLSVSIGSVGFKALLQHQRYGIWQHLNYLEIIYSALFFQFTLYIAIRLAHRGFTLGELGLVCFGGTALSMEFLNITIARIWPVTTPFIKTYRLPTPLLIFQMALIVGSFLTGFLLSPFLVLSRHVAQRPVRRLRFPQEKERHRRYLALGFYVGTVIVVGGLIGMWTRWCLVRRDPWLWVIFWILEGKHKWTRPALLAYWGSLGCLSVAGWNRQLARSRRYRPRNSTGENLIVPGVLDPSSSQALEPVAGSTASAAPSPSSGGSGSALGIGMTFPTLPALPNLPNGAHMSNVATDLLDAANKHVPTLGLNARRKFFHALAVVMFIPGVAFDPAFTHLSFSAAFALFTFTEYVRYFAIYPFGAMVHLFMNEFLDHRDRGTAILSHFYLLTGCAGSLWLEGPSQLLQFTGILTLGVGDAMASVVGKRIGLHRWSPTTSKTLEGSIAFTLSIFACAMALRLFGFVGGFSTIRYIVVVGISSVLEALSDQNDNLTLPLFMWSMLVLADV